MKAGLDTGLHMHASSHQSPARAVPANLFRDMLLLLLCLRITTLMSAAAFAAMALSVLLCLQTQLDLQCTLMQHCLH
jgi:cytochrome c oxidase assembly protein Cox11